MKRTQLKRGKPLQRKTPLKCRTELKQTGCLKRTPLRKTAKKKKENVNRYALDQYREANPECEFKGLLDPPGGHCEQLDPHHIARIRWDRKEFLLTLCRNCHDWGHKDDAQFIVWCLWKKWKKGELDLELLNSKKRGKRLEFYLVENPSYLELTNSMIEELRPLTIPRYAGE